ncbi:MAG: hypothetical protein AAFZ67_12200 [Planctomycetota bacterium]
MASQFQLSPPDDVLRRVRASRSVLARAAIFRALIASLPLAGAAAVAAAAAWYFFAGTLVANNLGSPASWALAAAVVVFAFLVTSLTFVLRRARRLPSMLSAAVELDQSAKTHSALASSLQFGQAPAGPFERWALADASAVAARNDLTMPAPQRPQRPLQRFGVGSALLAAALLLVTVLPPREWTSGVSAASSSQADPERVAEVQETIESARVEIAEAADDLGIDADDQFFESLEAELQDGVRDPDEAIASAAEQLDKLADSAETEADRAERARDEAAERLSELAPEDFSAARSLAESLAAGDFNRAAEEAEALQSQLDSGSTRDDLRNLADQLERAADRAAEPPADQPSDPDTEAAREHDALEQDLRDLAEELREKADATQGSEPPPPSMQPEQEEPDPSPPTDRPPANDEQRPPSESNERPEPDPSPREQQERPGGTPPPGQEQSDSDDQARDDTQPPPQDKRPANEREPGESEDSQRNPADQQEEEQRQPGDQRGQQQQQDSRPGDQTPDRQTPDEQTQEQPTNERPAEDQPTPDQPGSPMPDQPTETRQDPQPDANAPERQASPRPDQSPPGPGSPDPNTPGQPTPGDPEAPSPGGPTAPTPGDQAPDQPAEQPGGQAPDRPGGPSQDPSAQPTTLERLAQEQRRAEDLRRFADDLRDRADQMLGEESRGDRTPTAPDVTELAEDPATAADPWSAPTELIDARDRDAATDARERVISEWFKDPEGRPLDAAAPSEARDTIQRAARNAERAVEQQTVPRRYEDLVRRVFERYAERTQRPTDATDASDAQ